MKVMSFVHPVWDPRLVVIICGTFVALAICAAPGVAAADNELGSNVSPAFRRCMAAAVSNFDQGHCLEGELQRQKANLDAALKERLRGADPAFRVRVEKAQRAWLAFRDADCDAQTLHEGSGAAMSYLTCMVRLTANRAVEMESYGAF